MQIWTVLYVLDDDVIPFPYSYKSHDAAMKAVEKNAKEEYEAMHEPEDHGKFPGVDWNDMKMVAYTERDDEDAGCWMIQATELVE